MRQPFSGQVAWITGASSGIGRALALELARQGADVAVSARRIDRLAEVVREIQAIGRRALAVPCDVTDEAAIARAVAEVAAQLGGLHVAIANAGFGVMGRIEKLSAAEWRRQLDTNVVGLALTARHAIPELKKTRGRLALVGSVAGLVSAPGSGCYSASKAAVRIIGQTLAMELHGTGVSCTTLQPGFVDSEIAQVDNAGKLDPRRKDLRPLRWPTDRAARVMVRAIRRRRRDYVFTGHGRVGAFIGQHFPSWVHWVIVLTRGAAGMKRRSEP